MKATERRQRILQRIVEKGSAQIEDLVTFFEVSRMTAHRDLDALEQLGLVRRVRGGATAKASSLVESSYRYRSHVGHPSKSAIARAAVLHVEPGQAVILDDSTTVLSLAEHLPPIRPLTVITNGLGAIERLRDIPGIDLVSLGGQFNARYNAFFGLLCEEALAALRANILFVSTSAVMGSSAYHQDPQVVTAKRAMMRAAERRILLVDHAKFSATALHRLADLSEFDLVITDFGLQASQLSALRESGIPVEIAEPAAPRPEPDEREDESLFVRESAPVFGS